MPVDVNVSIVSGKIATSTTFQVEQELVVRVGIPNHPLQIKVDRQGNVEVEGEAKFPDAYIRLPGEEQAIPLYVVAKRKSSPMVFTYADADGNTYRFPDELRLANDPNWHNSLTLFKPYSGW